MSARAAGQAHAAKIAPDPVAPSGQSSAVTRAQTATAGSGTSRRRSETAHRVGRVGVFAIPILAILIGLGQFTRARFTASPTAYAHYLATDRYSWIEVATTIALGAVGVIAIVSLTLLLSASRARWVAIIGGAAALAGAVCLMISVGTLVVRAPRVADPLLRGRLDEVVINAQTRGTTTAIMVIVGAALLTIGWLLLGLAVFLTAGLSQGDGGLIGFSAPLVYIGGLFSTALPTIGAFMLGAAGLGIVGAAGRLGPARGPLTSPVRHRARRSPTSAFAFTDDMEGHELDGLNDEQIAAIYNFVEVGGSADEAAVAEELSDDAMHQHPAAERGSAAARSAHGTPTAWPVTRSESGAATHGAPEPSANAVKAAEPSPAALNGGAAPTGTANRTSDKTSGRVEEKASNAKRPSNDSRLNETPTGDVAAKPTSTARRGRFGRGKRPA